MTQEGAFAGLVPDPASTPNMGQVSPETASRGLWLCQLFGDFLGPQVGVASQHPEVPVAAD